MKKVTAIIIVFALLLVMSPSVLALDSSKNEIGPDKYNYDQLMEIAYEAFPIHRQRSTRTREETGYLGDELGDVVFVETKKLSDTETITYSEYSSGYTSYLLQVDWYYNYTNSGPAYNSVNTDIYVFSPLLSGTLYVRQFGYTLIQGGYDRIDSIGNVSTSSIPAYMGPYKLNEDASGSAYIYYSGVFEENFNDIPITLVLAVYVGNDNRFYEVY